MMTLPHNQQVPRQHDLVEKVDLPLPSCIKNQHLCPNQRQITGWLPAREPLEFASRTA